MNKCDSSVPIAGTTSPFTTSAELEQSGSDEVPVTGTRLLARAVILLAIHDLGAWCRKCHGGACHCRQVRLSAIRFLRGQDMEEVGSTLSLWAAAAGWPAEKLSHFFSEGNEGIWIPLVIKMRSPYRRARRGASAPLEASVIDLLMAYRPNDKLEIATYEAYVTVTVDHLCAALRSGTIRSLSDSERTSSGEPDNRGIPAVR